MSRGATWRAMVCGAALSLFASGWPAHAKAGDHARQKASELAFRALDSAFACMMHRNPGRVRAYMGTVPGSNREQVIGSYLYHQLGDCLSKASAVGISGVIGRGIAAERLLAVDFPTSPPPSPPVEPGEFGPIAGPMQVDGGIASAYAFARCIVIADPAGVRGLTGTARGSAAEARVLRAMRPRFPPCVARGATLKTDRWTIRPFLAEALYQVYRSRAGAGAARVRS
ncbi:MAG TPA: hypothetical protein VHM92_03470 [Allosphingosinicella sp.]|nr:hypothetical protein [Allosphingosinicella sp.]